MSLVKELTKLGVLDATEVESKLSEVWNDAKEMGQLKSNFDMEKFTTMKEGPFPAHQFHFLMRQYSLSLVELKRRILDKKERQRKIEDIKSGSLEEGTYPDIEIERHKAEIMQLELQIISKASKCAYFEKLRQHLIKKNGGTSPTNEQYQAEMPEYWKWFLQRKALWQYKQRLSGISEGVWENIDYLEEQALLEPSYEVPVLNHNAPNFEQQLAQFLEESEDNIEKLTTPDRKKLNG